MSQNTIKFTACKFLDFGDHFVETCQKNLIMDSGVSKVVWDRQDIDGNMQLCQFCTERGRLNYAKSCLSEHEKRCNDYEDFEHVIDLATVNLE